MILHLAKPLITLIVNDLSVKHNAYRLEVKQSQSN